MVQRVAIVGCPGTGKTTLAGTVASVLGLDHIELDALFHGPNWTPAEPSDFQAELQRRMCDAPDGWVVCGNYVDALDGRHLAEADTIVWLDLERSVVMRRVVQRTLRRAVWREELWNGNREPLSQLLPMGP